MIHIHSIITEQMNLVDIGNEFVWGSEHQQTMFGTFLATLLLYFFDNTVLAPREHDVHYSAVNRSIISKQRH